MKKFTLALAAIVIFAALITTKVANAQSEFRSNYFITSDSVKLHYLEAGSGPSIVFVPGFTMPAKVWEPQLTYFASDFHVVALDPRSQGRSQKVTEGHHLVRRGKDIGELIDHLEKDRVVIVGWSMGVHEILAYTREFGSDPFRGIILVDNFLAMKAEPGKSLPIEPIVKKQINGLQGDRRSWTREWLQGMYHSERSDDYLESMTEAVLKTPTNTAITLLSNQLLMEDLDFRPVVDKLKLPVLFVFSSQDWAVAEAEMIRKRWPKVEVAVIKDSGHALFVDKTEEFNRLLKEFLATLPEN